MLYQSLQITIYVDLPFIREYCSTRITITLINALILYRIY